jgi:xylulokinase
VIAVPVLAGVDVGTTHVKVGFFGPDGRAAALARAAMPQADSGDWRGYPVDAVVARVLDGLAACRSEAGVDPVAVGVAGMAESGVPLDRSMTPLTPIIPWHDLRAGEEAAGLARVLGRTRVFQVTGRTPAAKCPLPKLVWLRRHRPELHARVARWAGAPDVVALALTGRLGTDPTLAARTMAWDVRGRRWHEGLLGEAGLTPEQMPPVHGSGEPVGSLRPDAARAAGLAAGVPVVVAGHDHLVAAYGAGVRRPGQVADSTGTAEAVVLPTAAVTLPAAAADRGITAGPWVVGDRGCLVAGLSSSGRLVDWFCAGFLAGGPDPFGRFDALARAAGDEPTGVLVEPYLLGRDAPRPDPARRLSISGLGPRHGPGHLARALLEGVAYQVRWMTEEAAACAGAPVRQLALFGSATRRPAWPRIRAEVSAPTEVTATTVEAATAGAALLAAPAAGVEPGPQPSAPDTPAPVPADPDRAAQYDLLYRQRFLPLATADCGRRG